MYLDVDGVVSPLVDVVPATWGWREARRARVGGLPVLWAPQLVARLNALAARPHVRMHWLTSWEAAAATHLCPSIGLHGEQWSVLRRSPSPGRRHAWWKLSALDAAASGARVAWLDDDLDQHDEATAWVRSQPFDALAFSPDPKIGLTPLDVDALEAFVG